MAGDKIIQIQNQPAPQLDHPGPPSRNGMNSMGYMGETPCRLESELQPSVWSRRNRPPLLLPQYVSILPHEREVSFSMLPIYFPLAISIDAHDMVWLLRDPQFRPSEA